MVNTHSHVTINMYPQIEDGMQLNFMRSMK